MMIENFDTNLRQVKLRVKRGNEKILDKLFVSTKKSEIWEIPHFTEQVQNEPENDPNNNSEQSENMENSLYETLTSEKQDMMKIPLKMPSWVNKLYDKRITSEPYFIKINNVSDCKTANHFPEGRIIIKLLLLKMDLYDELGPKKFADGFNQLIRSFYSRRFNFCDDNYDCLKLDNHAIRFLQVSKRNQISHGLIKKRIQRKILVLMIKL